MVTVVLVVAAAVVAADHVSPVVVAHQGSPLRDVVSAEELAGMLRGRTVLVGKSVVHVDDVAVDAMSTPLETTFALRASVTPLFVVKDVHASTRTSTAGSVHHDMLVLGPQCGTAAPDLGPGRDIVVDVAKAWVLDGDRFRGAGELSTPALRQRVPLPLLPPQVLASKDRARLQACLQQRARGAIASLHTLKLFAGTEQRALVRVGVDAQTVVVEGEVEQFWDDLRVVVAPADGVVVERQTVSVMQCNGEGPHVELYDWKQGVTAWKLVRKRAPGEFIVDDQPFADAPDFPGFTPAEFAKVKPAGFADEECRPTIGAVRFRLRRGTETLQTLEVRPAMGC